MNRINPSANGSAADILIDNENVQQIEITGDWKLNKDSKNSYAVSSLISEGSTSSSAGVKFIPAVPSEKKYKVYSYLPKNDRLSPILYFDIYDGKTLHKVESNLKDFKVEGQTSGEWLYVGEYVFKKGGDNYITINPKGEGLVVADAVILVASND